MFLLPLAALARAARGTRSSPSSYFLFGEDDDLRFCCAPVCASCSSARPVPCMRRCQRCGLDARDRIPSLVFGFAGKLLSLSNKRSLVLDRGDPISFWVDHAYLGACCVLSDRLPKPREGVWPFPYGRTTLFEGKRLK